MSYVLPLFLSLGLAIAAPNLSIAGPDQPKVGGTLTFASHRDISTMNPMVRTSSHNEWVRRLMFEPILEVDENGKVQPYLAESWDISSDGKTYTFRLRSGVKFHNGQEMTAQDAKFAMDYTLNPKNGASGHAMLSLVDRVEVPDKYTLKVHLKRPTPAFIKSLTTIESFSVVPKGSLADGKRKPDTFPPGTGPFRFVEWKANQRHVFARNENYWRAKPYLDRVIFRPIANSTIRFVALRSGDVDLIVRAPGQWIRQLVKGKVKGLRYFETPNSGLYRIQFNTVRPPFDNKKLRQAVAHAIHRKELVQATFFGFGQPTSQKYPEGDPWHFDGISPLVYDTNKAKALIKESGYKGEEVELAVSTSSVNQTLAATVQAQLRRVGIKVKILSLESGASRRRSRSGEFTFRVGGAGAGLDPSATYSRELRCVSDLKRRIGNVTGYCDPEMEALIKRSEKEMNQEARREIFKQIIIKFNDDVPGIYLAFNPRFFALRDYVKGFTSYDDEYEWLGGGLSRTWLDK